MTTNYTSGPWCIHRAYAKEVTRTVTDDNGESWEFTHTHIGSGEKIVAQVQHRTKDSGWPHVHDVGEMWANARLIAAAPEMLEALRTIYANAAESPEWIRARIEDAIAKAEGRGA